MDRTIQRPRWSPLRWPLSVRLAVAIVVLSTVALLAIRLIAGAGTKTLRLPGAQVSIATVERGVFRDLIPLNARVTPRETVYIDAVDGGRVDRLFVEAGDMVQEGQPLIALSNTNLALQVIQQESQLNQAISQLQQNEIALEQSQLSNDLAIAAIDYNLVRLQRSSDRREGLAQRGVLAEEQRDAVTDELTYYKRLKPIQAESGRRQADLRERLLPDIRAQVKILRGNLAVVHDKLDALVIRAPVTGRVTALDLKVGENRSPGQRLAEVTPDSGMKLVADVDEFYLSRVHAGQVATVDIDGKPVDLTVRRVFPQVQGGQFRIDLDFGKDSPATLVAGAAAQGRLKLGGDSNALLLPSGPFLERTGGAWVFVVAHDGNSAERRNIKVGRRTFEQVEVVGGLAAGDRVITSDYSSLDRADRIILEN
jgi:HlyD family secretion protein